jgi:hypothetical protein
MITFSENEVQWSLREQWLLFTERVTRFSSELCKGKGKGFPIPALKTWGSVSIGAHIFNIGAIWRSASRHGRFASRTIAHGTQCMCGGGGEGGVGSIVGLDSLEKRKLC